MLSSIIFYISITIVLSIISFTAGLIIVQSLLKKKVDDKFKFIKDKDGKIIDYQNNKKTSVFIDGKPLYMHTQVACLDLYGVNKETKKLKTSLSNNMQDWIKKRYKIAESCVVEDNDSDFKNLLSGKLDKLKKQRDKENDNIKKMKISEEIYNINKKIMQEKEKYITDKEKEYKQIVDNFIDKVKNDENIKLIKLSLRSHGSEYGELQISPYYIKYFLQKIKDENIKLPIYVKNIACFQAQLAEKTSLNSDNESKTVFLNIKKELFDFAKDNNIELFYSEHENLKTSFKKLIIANNFEKNNVYKEEKIDTLQHHHLFRDKNNNFQHDLYDKKNKQIFKSLLDNLVDINDVQRVDKVL